MEDEISDPAAAKCPKTIEKRRRTWYNATMSVSVKAYAKLNLTLAVTGATDGYHDIDSLVCTVDLFDLVKLRKRKDDLVGIEMHGMGSESIGFEQNNAVKAAESYIRKFGTRGVDIRIYKNIPMGAGLGGSSADAAGVIRGMSMLYGLGSERELKELADASGSDTGYLLTGGFARITGRGERVEPVETDVRLDFFVLLPHGGVSTAACYSLWDEAPHCGGRTDEALNALLAGDKAALGRALFNDLTPPAIRLNGGVAEALEQLKGFSPLGVNMTGSGSGAFALFENAEFCEWARSRYRGRAACMRLKTVIPKR